MTCENQIAGGIPKKRARALHPHMLRATVLTQLLEEGVPADRVKDIAMHASVDTTLRYDRRRTSLTGHPLYVWPGGQVRQGGQGRDVDEQ
ncbi:site-specific integrase [Sphaerisporangium fuscum]|uniref:site-specific integrase n=1 Tax=Sphaerisporangium fuscum TaxID=2835868 RepID=UPI001BDBF828|nr:site-specific integrase [Sphaerisporangium fuscum]